MRGVHVTMALAALRGKLDEYLALRAGLNTIELDVKDENGEVGFVRGASPLARAHRRREAVLQRASARHGRSTPPALYLIGRVVTFEDPVSRRAAARARDPHEPTARVWHTSAGLGWTNPYDRRVWNYNVDIADGGGEGRLRRDPVRLRALPERRRPLADPLPGHARRSRWRWTIPQFVQYAVEAAAPARRRASRSTSSGSRRPATSASARSRAGSRRYVDAVYPMVYPSHFSPGEYDLADPNAHPGQTVTDSLLDFQAAAARVEGAADAVAAGLLARPHVHARRRPGAGRRARARPTRAASCSGTPVGLYNAPSAAPCLHDRYSRMQAAGRCAIVSAMAVTRAIELRTEIPGPRSQAILERKERVVADPLSIYLPGRRSPRRSGATLTDVDGNTFIDFTGGVGCLNVGHSHPRVVEAAQEQLDALRAHRLHDRPVRGLRRRSPSG